MFDLPWWERLQYDAEQGVCTQYKFNQACQLQDSLVWSILYHRAIAVNANGNRSDTFVTHSSLSLGAPADHQARTYHYVCVRHSSIVR